MGLDDVSYLVDHNEFITTMPSINPISFHEIYMHQQMSHMQTSSYHMLQIAEYTRLCKNVQDGHWRVAEEYLTKW